MGRSLTQAAPDDRDAAEGELLFAYDHLDDRAMLETLLERIDAGQGTTEALLDRFGTLAAAVAADPVELLRTPGVTAATVSRLKLMRALAVRLARSEASRRPVITSWDALLAYARTALAHAPREQFRALFLDNRNILMVDEEVANGTVDHAPVYPREVLRRALELSASALILVHNHPAGSPEPSRADIEMTRKIADAAKLFGIRVHDHLIVAREGTASLRALGLLR